MVQPLGDTMHHRVLEPFMMQHGGIDKRCELRLAADDVFSLGAHAIPDRVERGKLGALRTSLMLCHVLLSRLLKPALIIARGPAGCPAPVVCRERGCFSPLGSFDLRLKH